MMRWLLLLIAFPLLSHAAVERLVTLGGDVTEIVYALGAQQSLVARDSTSSWPPAAQKLPDVGYLRQLNAEGILALRPQLVLASAQAQPSLVLHKVQASGVKVVNVPGGESLAAIDSKVAVIAEALGKTPAGDALRQQLQQQIAAIPTQPVTKRVLFILSHGGMNTLVAGQRTAADGAIRAAGLQNAMQGFDHYRAMSQEGVAASQADLVVISADGLKGMGGEAGLWKLPGLAQTPAGRHKQLLTIDDMACSVLGRAPRRRLSRCVKKRSICPDAPCPRPPFAVDDAAAGPADAVRHHPWRDAFAAGQPAARRG